MSAASAKLYVAIWGWLAGLMLLGVVLCELPILPAPRALIIALVVGLSTVKAALVALYYMHLKMDQRLLALIAAFPIALLVLVGGLLASSLLVHF